MNKVLGFWTVALVSLLLGQALAPAPSQAQFDGGQRAADVANLSVATLADLRALVSRPSIVAVSGYAKANDGGGGLFAWVAGDTATAADAGRVVRPANGPGGLYRRLTGEPVNLKWFGAVGDGVTNDTPAIAAIDGAALPSQPVSVPLGSYATAFPDYTVLFNRYSGPGQLRIGGHLQAPDISTFNSPLPPLPSNRFHQFDGTSFQSYRRGFTTVNSSVTGKHFDNFVGDGVTATFRIAFTPTTPGQVTVGLNGSLQTTGYVFENPTVTFAVAPPKGAAITIADNSSNGSAYFNYPQYGSDIEVYQFNAGYNADFLNQNLGRTGAAAHWLNVENGGGGDLTGYITNCNVYGFRPGAVHFLAEPSCALFGGNLAATVDGAYLQPHEISISDNGYSVASAAVVNYTRNGAGTGLGQVWVGFRGQSAGIAPVDAGYTLAGNYARGIDFTPVTTANFPAIDLKAGQRIYCNASGSNDKAGVVWFASRFGDCYVTFDAGTNRLIVSPGESASLFVPASIATTGTLTAANSVQFGGAAATGLFADGTNIGVRAFGRNAIYFQSAGGTTNYAVLTSAALAVPAVIQHGKSTVSAMPPCNSAAEGSRYGVTDALAPTFLGILKGGGTVHAGAYCNGTNWIAN